MANVLGVLSAFLVWRLSFSLDETGVLAVSLACLAMPVIPVCYAFTVARRSKQSLPQYLRGPEASRVTNAMLGIIYLASTVLAISLASFVLRKASDVVQAKVSLPDSFIPAGLFCMIALCFVFSGMRDRHRWLRNKNGALATSDETNNASDDSNMPTKKDDLEEVVAGVLLLGWAIIGFATHVIAENLSGHPILVFGREQGRIAIIFGGTLLLFLILFHPIVRAITRRIRTRQANNRT